MHSSTYQVKFAEAVFGHDLEDIIDVSKKFKRVVVECDDGFLEISSREFVVNYICWQMFNALDKEFPSSCRYSIHEVKHFNRRTHLDLCGSILKDYIAWNESRGVHTVMGDINEQVFILTNMLYNFVDNELDSFTSDISFGDIYEIWSHPEIYKANMEIQSTKMVSHSQIQEVYKIIKRVVLTCPTLDKNSACIAARCGVIKLTQLCMVIGPIGYCTDIDSKIIKKAITRGFFQGMNELCDLTFESRNASIAGWFAIVIMPLAEYANRREQMPSEYVVNKVVGDCGGTSARIYVIDKEHLESLKGFVKTDGRHGKSIGYVSPDHDQDLIGKYSYFRTINRCRMMPRNTVCTTCLGLMHYAFPDGAVIGHVSAAEFGGSTSTRVLQRKHENLTSEAGEIELTGGFEDVFKSNSIGNGLLFNDGFNYSKWSIYLTPKAAQHLNEVNSEYGDALIASQTTKIEILDIRHENGLESFQLPIGVDQRSGFLTKEFLRYIKRVGWEYVDGNIYKINLSSWKNEDSFLTIPQIEFTPPDLIESIAQFIFSGTKGSTVNPLKAPSLSSCVNVDDAYASFYDLVRGQLKIHSVHLMMIILAMSAQDPDNNDYRLPYPREDGRPTKLDNIMFYRSISGAMAYEEQAKVLTEPLTYLIKSRPPHVYDKIFMG